MICSYVCMLGVRLDGIGDESIKIRGLSDWKAPAITDCDMSAQVCNSLATQVALWSKDEGESCGTGRQVQIEEPSVSSDTEDETSDSHSSNSSLSALGDLSDTDALETGAFDLPDEVFNFQICMYEDAKYVRMYVKYVCACTSRRTSEHS